MDIQGGYTDPLTTTNIEAVFPPDFVVILNRLSELLNNMFSLYDM